MKMRTWETETRRDPDPPRGLVMTDLSDVPRRRRVQYAQDIAAIPTFVSEAYIRAQSRVVSVPKPPPPGPWPEQTSSSRQVYGRIVLEPNPHPTTESVYSMPSAPRSPTPTINTTDWDHITESDREDTHASHMAHLRDSEDEWY